MEKLSKFAFMLLLLASLFGCKENLFKPTSVTFTPAEFQAALSKKFPVHKNYLGLIDLTISHPEVSMRPEIKHIAMQFDADISALGASQVVTSKLDITTSLAYDSVTRSIVLKDPRLEKIDVAGMSNERARMLTQLASVLINETLQSASIYTFNPDDLHFIGMSLEPESIDITEQGVVVHIAP